MAEGDSTLTYGMKQYHSNYKKNATKVIGKCNSANEHLMLTLAVRILFGNRDSALAKHFSFTRSFVISRGFVDLSTSKDKYRRRKMIWLLFAS
jgi:hypothetical protein